MSHVPMRFHDRRDGAYQVIFMEPGTDATQDFIYNFGTFVFKGFYSSVSGPAEGGGAITSSTTTPNTGPRCIRCDSEGNLLSKLITYDFGVNLKTGGRVSYYFKIGNAFPAAETQILILDRVAVDSVFFFKLGTDGKIRAYIVNGIDGLPTILVGTSSNSVLQNTWQRICVAVRIINNEINECRVYLDGLLEITISNIFFEITGSFGRIHYGWVSAGAGTDRLMFLDDLYVDNNDTLEDCGNIRVTAKLPASNNTNNFATAIGNNPANRWENVSERPVTLTNGWRENSGGPYPIDENYGIQSASAGDVDISGYSGTYPSLNPGIGLRTSTTEGCDLWDCGVVVAFSDTTNSIVGFMSWVLAGTVTGTGSNDIDIWSNGALFDTDRQVSNSAVTKVIYFSKNTITAVPKPMIFHSVSDNQPFIFSTRD